MPIGVAAVASISAGFLRGHGAVMPFAISAVALALIPVLVILSVMISPHHLTLSMPPLLVVALSFAAALGAVIVYDGESVWLEGVALIGLYGIIAASFWWG